MMKKFALAVGVAAALSGASAAHAGYYETFNSFGGNFLINGFEDGDKKFNISLTNLNGVVSLQLPAAGTYGASITPGSTLSVDYNGIPGADLAVGPLSVAYPIGSATISSISGFPPGTKSLGFNFDTAVSTMSINGFINPVALNTTQKISVAGSGATSLFAALLGLPGFLTGNVSGTLGVEITFKQDELDFVIDGSSLTGANLEASVKALDDAVANLNDGKIDGTFSVNGSVHIPEPGSLALLGLGLVGLAARRRKAVKAA